MELIKISMVLKLTIVFLKVKIQTVKILLHSCYKLSSFAGMLGAAKILNFALFDAERRL